MNLKRAVATTRRAGETMLQCACRPENLGRFVIGLAIPYNDVATLPDGVQERIEPGAFGDSFADVYATLNHDVSKILGLTSDDTLSLWEEERGIVCVLDPESAHASRNHLEMLIRLDAVTGMSFRMRDVTAVYSRDSSMKTVTQATLVDVSVLTRTRYPSYRKTMVRFTRDRLAD